MNQFEVAQGFIEQCQAGVPVGVLAPTFQQEMFHEARHYRLTRGTPSRFVRCCRVNDVGALRATRRWLGIHAAVAIYRQETSPRKETFMARAHDEDCDLMYNVSRCSQGSAHRASGSLLAEKGMYLDRRRVPERGVEVASALSKSRCWG